MRGEKEFILSYPKYFWSTYNVAGTVLGIWNSSVNKTNKCVELML